MHDTDKADLISALRLVVPAGDIQRSVPMSGYTNLRLGGPAELLLEISDDAQVPQVLKIAARYQAPVHVVGNGTNLLVKDGGLPGITLHFGSRFSDISKPATRDGETFLLTAQAGASLAALANAAADAGLTGLEFASGIPGTVGGGVRMNAGAYGGTLGDLIVSVTCVTLAGETKTYSHDEMQFSYRHSCLTDEILLFATVRLRRGDAETMRVAMRELNTRRRDKQPLNFPCCGSTFKRPPGRFAGELIESCGLKGCRIGGVSVSEKHANFLVNDREGTAADYLQLIEHVQHVVKEKTGIDLQPEVQIIGEDE